MKTIFGLKIGDNINVGDIIFPISMFEKDKLGCWWAILGNIEFLPNFGYYGDRMWLISTPEESSCWKVSKWKKI